MACRGGGGASLNLSQLQCGWRNGSMTTCNPDTLKAPTKKCQPFVNRSKTLAKYCKPLQPTTIRIDCSCRTTVCKVLLWVPISLQTVYNDSLAEMITWLWGARGRTIWRLGHTIKHNCASVPTTQHVNMQSSHFSCERLTPCPRNSVEVRIRCAHHLLDTQAFV